jgi:hypothetical protein
MEAPQTHHIIIPMSWFGFIGLVLGTIVSFGVDNKYKMFVVAGMIAFGLLIGWWISRWLLEKREKFFYYEVDLQYTNQPELQSIDTSRYMDVQVWTDKTTSQWIRLGLTDAEWRDMATKVHTAQAFSTDVLDRKIYGKIKKRFEEIGLIARAGQGSGYALTRDGKNFVMYLATIPFPYSEVPELVKYVDSSDAP